MIPQNTQNAVASHDYRYRLSTIKFSVDRRSTAIAQIPVAREVMPKLWEYPQFLCVGLESIRLRCAAVKTNPDPFFSCRFVVYRSSFGVVYFLSKQVESYTKFSKFRTNALSNKEGVAFCLIWPTPLPRRFKIEFNQVGFYIKITLIVSILKISDLDPSHEWLIWIINTSWDGKTLKQHAA